MPIFGNFYMRTSPAYSQTVHLSNGIKKSISVYDDFGTSDSEATI